MPQALSATSLISQRGFGRVFYWCVVVIFVPLATTGFGFTPSYFLFACAKEKVTKEKAHPASGFRCAQLDSLRSPSGPAFGCYSASLRFLVPALLRGSSRWAIPGPS